MRTLAGAVQETKMEVITLRAAFHTKRAVQSNYLLDLHWGSREHLCAKSCELLASNRWVNYFVGVASSLFAPFPARLWRLLSGVAVRRPKIHPS